MLKVALLTSHFHSSNGGLLEVLQDKKRGYGVVTINLNDLTFGIPLRTNLQHRYGVYLDSKTKNGITYRRGLDFTKAILIRDFNKDIGDVFRVSEKQKKVLIQRKKMIKNQFGKYVQGYVNAAKKGAISTLSSPAYRFSTLINYHEELGI